MGWRRTIAVAATLAASLTAAPAARAAPVSPAITAPAAAPARVVSVVRDTPTLSRITIASPAMGRDVQVQLSHPDRPGSRPTYYLLDGVEAPDTGSDWLRKTDAASFFADKNVNVVFVVGGRGSYYTNWQKPDPVLGVNQWETFLTRELPPIIDGQFGGNGLNAIGGVSMGGQSALILAARNPSRYRAVAAYSTCQDTNSTAGRDLVRMTVASRGGDPVNMWGDDTSPEWVQHDPFTLARNYLGMTVYVSVGNGVLGVPDLQSGNDVATMMSSGAALEFGTWACTHAFEDRLAHEGVPAQFVFRPVGTHSWPWWQIDLHHSWPSIARALGTS